MALVCNCANVFVATCNFGDSKEVKGPSLHQDLRAPPVLMYDKNSLVGGQISSLTDMLDQLATDASWLPYGWHGSYVCTVPTQTQL